MLHDLAFAPKQIVRKNMVLSQVFFAGKMPHTIIHLSYGYQKPVLKRR